MKLVWIVRKLRVWVCEGCYPVGVNFLGLPVGVPAVREKVPQSFVTV